MSESVSGVTPQIEIEDVDELPCPQELPERLQEAATLWQKLGFEWFETLSRKAPVLRNDGYQLPTLILFFFALFTGEFRPSIKYVCEVLVRPKNRLLAAFAGLLKFPTQASVSRFLKRVQLARLEEAMGWMLVFSHEQTRRLMQHRSSAGKDTFGNPWHVFDLDPTSTVVRQRALPEHKELPPALRRYAELAGPGYTGRKRGEALFRRVVLQHTGTSLWLGSWLRYAGAGARETFAAAIKTVVDCCEFIGIEVAQAILRIDGEGGNVPTITACQLAGISFVMRGTHLSILDRPEIRQQLLTGQWYEVADSGSGPQRFALDLGEIELTASASIVDDEGKPYPPVKCRVIVTRFEATEKRSSGVLIDNHLFEIFVTNLPAAAWPASDVGTLYCHRATEENRFGREDKELSLDTVFSQTPQGQSLATLLGLLVWNLRVIFGFEAAESEIDEVTSDSPSARQARPAPAPTAMTSQDEEEKTPGDDDVCEKAESTEYEEELAQLRQLIVAMTMQGCSTLDEECFYWDEDHGLRCAKDYLFSFSRIREMKGNHYVNLLAPPGVCADCDRRQSCSRSISPTFRKDRLIRLESPEVAEALSDLLRRFKQLTMKAELSRRRSSVNKKRKTPLSTQSIDPCLTPHSPAEPGPYQIVLPRLNPAALKKRFASAVVAVSISVDAGKEPSATPRNHYLYQSSADRARRRRTWTQRLSYNRRKGAVVVHVYRAPAANTLFGTA